jgi:hypothetical protein
VQAGLGAVYKHLGELGVENELLREKIAHLEGGVSAAISPATSQRFGTQRVCRIWGLPRSSFYYASRRDATAQPAARRGPVPPVAEDRLQEAIQADLAASRHSVVRGIARSGQGCGMASGSWSGATGCCG